VKVDPAPVPLTASMLPPCASTTALQIASPSPACWQSDHHKVAVAHKAWRCRGNEEEGWRVEAMQWIKNMKLHPGFVVLTALFAISGCLSQRMTLNSSLPMSPIIHTVHIRLDRRRLLRSLLLSTGGVITSSIYAEALTLTPRQTEGPYYPDHLPLDQDNDLIQVQGDKDPAGGIIANLGGRLLHADGKPIQGAIIELWQSDNNGCYIHSKGAPRGKERDTRFQGYGKFETNAKGEYRFRTIKPGLYTGRTRHFHVAVLQNGKRMLTTQLYFAGEPQNERDGILKGIRDEAQRLSVIREFKPVSAGSPELVGTWDIVIGTTPEDKERRGPGGSPPGGRRPPPPPQS
jgi:protocatechuate 3,4-dioxygenase, beta subunit